MLAAVAAKDAVLVLQEDGGVALCRGARRNNTRASARAAASGRAARCRWARAAAQPSHARTCCTMNAAARV
jgi:hypothetical protein